MDDRDRDIDDEIRFHLQEEERLLAGRGAPPAQAQRDARRLFGGVALTREDTRAVWAWTALEQAWQDVRIGARLLRKSPGFTAAAVLTLALGIGANTAVFSLFKAIVLDPLPVPDPDRLVFFSDITGEGTQASSTPPEGAWSLFSMASFEYLRAQPLPFASLTAVRSGETDALLRLESSSGPPERARVHLIAGNYFETMDVGAVQGRALSANDDQDGAPPAAVISYPFWRDHLGADASVIGRVVHLNDLAATIVGVAPDGFFGERIRRSPDFWVPLRFQPEIEQRASRLEDDHAYWLSLIGRLAPGATREGAEQAATTALRQFVTGRAITSFRPNPVPDGRRRASESMRVELFSGAGGISTYRERLSAPLSILLGVVALVLLIACLNVGNLLVAKAAARRAEFSMRVALGASRGRLARQLLVESLLLAGIGGTGGVVLAGWSLHGLVGLIGASSAPVHANIEGRVLLFTGGVTFAAAFVFGCAPMLGAGRADVIAALKTRGAEGRTGGFARLREPLVMLQVALCLTLLVGAGLLARSLVNLDRRDPGFDMNGVLVARVYPRMAGYAPLAVNGLYDRLLDRIDALPGVEHATIARYTPASGSRSRNTAEIEGYTPRLDEDMNVETVLVGRDFPETMRIPIRLGRSIDVTDARAGRSVAMVNEAFVRRFFNGSSPIGRHVSFHGSPVPPAEIVGVIGDAQFHDAREPIDPAAFVPELASYGQFTLDAELVVRTMPAGVVTAEEIRRAILEVDSNLPMEPARPLRDQVTGTFSTERLSARLVGGFSVLALLLACIGLYGVTAENAVRRTREIGIRLALGASRGQVQRMMLNSALRPLALGLLVGVPAALAASRLLSGLLFGVSPADPWALAGAALILTIVAVAAGFIPSRRASRVDPITTLRAE